MPPLLAQGLPPIPNPGNLDISQLVTNVGLALLWTVAACLSFAVAITIGVRLLSALFPQLDAIQEIKRGNLAVALFASAFLFCLAAVVVAVLLK